jgi:catalase
MSKDEQKKLFANTERATKGVPEEIKLRWICLCAKADPEYGIGLARQLGLEAGGPISCPPPVSQAQR